MKKEVATTNAPGAVGPYSQGVIAGKLLFVSGQIPLDPKTGAIVAGGIEAQANQVFQNLAGILHEAGADFKDVAKATVFLDKIGDFAKVNEIYASYFKDGVLPARSAVEVGALPKDALIEIELIVDLDK